MYRPLADKIRPKSLSEMVGQRHILGENGILRRIISGGHAPNMVFYGPPGCGKTTAANIIADETDRSLRKLNATTASISDIREIIGSLGTFEAMSGVLLYLDEIQYFNKKQQQSLLEFIENGSITLIASTTENPYFYVYGALLSRSTMFEFKPVPDSDMVPAIERALLVGAGEMGFDVRCESGVIDYIAASSSGDVRKAVNAVELLLLSASARDGCAVLTLSDTQAVAQRSAVMYDRDGDSHYDILSAFQKSIRGSDPDAAVYYLARLLAAGDMQSASRRLLVTAAEDIGLGNPQAIAVVKACVDAAFQIGLPEAQIPLAEAVIFLATCPKSNSAVNAISLAMQDVKSGKASDIPAHLRDSHYGGAKKLGRGLTYKYPHDYPRSYVTQHYLPDGIEPGAYYKYGENKIEELARRYWEEVKRRD